MVIATARINRLPQVVADAIAAGEVVERPASVVKELVENALDAGASRIAITLAGGGLVRIEVADDGAGIRAVDLELAVSRHATSKIARVDDLTTLRTLGFRGEALASIAAVADLLIVSRCADAAAGSALRVRAGDIVDRHTSAAPAGTRVEVCELFASTPARLRFLKNTGAEAAAAARVVTELALLHPSVSFTLTVDRRVVVRTPGGTLRETARALLGPDADALVDVAAAGTIAVHGLVSAPHAHRGQRAGLVLAVNGRRIQHRGLQVAVQEAYRGLIPPGRFPYGVVMLDVDPADVDVNVHPAKREVRFRDERRAFTSVQLACSAAVHSERVTVESLTLVDAIETTEPSTLTLEDAREIAAPAPAAEVVPGAVLGEGAVTLERLTPLTALGQSGGEWIVAGSLDDRGRATVVLVDPHAAHEKVLYAELLERWSDASARGGSQLLLIPVVVRCDAEQAERVVQQRAFIESCGFALEAFGPDMVRCTAVPAAASADAEPLVRDLLDTLAGDAIGVDARRHAVAALVACHSAVRFGDNLDAASQQRLLDRLVVTPGGTSCPHGRPTVVVLEARVLRRIFKRPL